MKLSHNGIISYRRDERDREFEEKKSKETKEEKNYGVVLKDTERKKWKKS